MTERCILQKLQDTSNWIAELSILKKVLGCVTNKVHTKVVKYIQKSMEVCLRKENTLHLLYDCHRVKDKWHEIGKCLNLNIQPKHIVLGLTDEHYVEINRHLCIIIVAFSIYSIWCKCSFEKLNHSNVNLRIQFGILLRSFFVSNA